jgi:small subunit ribosomal protein S2
MKELLEAGVHFGHQTRRWDPKMRQYIFTERNGIHIIDLQKTITLLKVAYNAIKELSKKTGTILFVGTKRQAQSAIVEEATRCGMPFVANRWLGGMVTNFETIKKSIMKLKRIERMEVDGTFDYMIKKEIIGLRREKDKLIKNIGGIKEMETLPDMVFIIDPKKEAIALAEAMKAGIPIVAIVDTNCSPDGIDYPIPGNDDAIRAINLFCSIVSSAVIEGQTEAGKIEITEETKIMSLTEEEVASEEIAVAPGAEAAALSGNGQMTVAVEGNEEDLEEELTGAEITDVGGPKAPPGVKAPTEGDQEEKEAAKVAPEDVADEPAVDAEKKGVEETEVSEEKKGVEETEVSEEKKGVEEMEVSEETEVSEEKKGVEETEVSDEPKVHSEPPKEEHEKTEPVTGRSKEPSTKLDAQSEDEEKETELKGE